jgi:hypothetical protein
MPAAITASTWTPADWIAFAGVVATACGAFTTLAGVWLGARMAERNTQRRDAETALVAVELARNSLDVEDLSTEDLIDDSQSVDHSADRMARIDKADAARLAHEAITAVIARRSEPEIVRVAYELNARLSTVQQLVSGWYRHQLYARQATGQAKDVLTAKAAELLGGARSALGELNSKTDEFRRLTLGEGGVPQGAYAGLLGQDPWVTG